MLSHAESLKGVLVQAIAGKHPSRPNDITDNQFNNCRLFLSNFIGVDRPKPGKVFTLNYDLLLYWTILHDGWNYNAFEGTYQPDMHAELKHDDGFRALEDEPNAEYVAWEQFSTKSQSITFLHGGLHLYEKGPDLAKLCWERSGGKPLMDQIRKSLDQGRYPLYVSEGHTQVKLKRINQSAYLSKGLRSFSECCMQKGASLFIIGHSLADNDDHILNRIAKGKIGKLYISLFGDIDSERNREIRQKAEKLANRRSDFYPLIVHYIDASTLHIWEH